MNTPTITATSLYFREGNSDKEYHLAVEPKGEGYIVTYAYGRRGSNLTTGTKTPHIVTLAQAGARIIADVAPLNQSAAAAVDGEK